jgi:succinyl-CoA synthetase beta subunit
MNLLEHESKALLKASGIPTPVGQVVQSLELPSLSVPLILKSQVPIGGRGKAGGIILIKEQSEIEPALQHLFQHSIKGLLPKTILAEEALSIQKELYLALLVDRATMSIQLVAHTQGGIEVESQTDFKKWTLPYGQLDVDAIGQSLADYYDLAEQTFALQNLVQNLYRCFTDSDATLIEINPLILTTEGKLIAGDCKMTLDDAAAFRHTWSYTEPVVETNFVTIDPEGNTATIANGAGLAMATVDAAYEAGLKPANFLDIGGGASADSLLSAFNRILAYPNVRVIIINIFAGITRSDEVAKAIITAKKQIPDLSPLYIRLAGTNQQEAAQLLIDSHIAIEPTLQSCLQKAKEYIG